MFPVPPAFLALEVGVFPALRLVVELELWPASGPALAPMLELELLPVVVLELELFPVSGPALAPVLELELLPVVVLALGVGLLPAALLALLPAIAPDCRGWMVCLAPARGRGRTIWARFRDHGPGMIAV